MFVVVLGITYGPPAWSARPDADGAGGKTASSVPRGLSARQWAQAKRMLPKGWTLKTRGLPSGVAVAALGPRSEQGRAVVTLRPWPRGFAVPRHPDTSQALGRLFGFESGFPEWRGDEPLGPVVDRSLDGGLRVRHVLHDDGLLTITAPPRLLPGVYRRVLKAAESLEAGRKARRKP